MLKKVRLNFDWERWLGRLVLILLLTPALLVGALRWINPPITSFMIGAKWDLTRSGEKNAAIRYRWVNYERIAPAARLAVIAAEDQNFATHRGFDWQAIGKAMQHNPKSQRMKGASTISQQVAKNLFLWERRSWLRKGIEAYFTLWIEWLWPKQRILEVYLNTAQFDARTFGVGAAAQRFFGRPAASLSYAQAALLAAVLPAPRRLSAAEPSDYVEDRQDWILGQMRRLGSQTLAAVEQD
ncbi:MAG: monofunctional biosynthetic peptidoglycan transglycosylase [Nevskiales bacterium]